MSIEEVRDIVIVVGGAVTVLYALIVLAFLIYLYFLYRRTRGAVRRFRGSDIDPIVEQVRGLATEARATATFYNDYGVRNIRNGWRMFRRVRRATSLVGQLRLLVSTLLLVSRLRSALRALREVRAS